MAARITHFEIYGEAPSKLADFYQSIFDWNLEKVPGIDYWRFQPDSTEGSIGGGLTYRPNITPHAWVNYVTVDSLDDVIGKAERLGGKVLRPKTAVARTGWCAIVADPEGNIFALWETDPKAMPMPEPD